MNVLVFNIETIPDIEGGQAIYDLKGLDDKSTVKAMKHIHQQKTGSNILPLHLNKIIAISFIQHLVSNDESDVPTVQSLGDESSTEAELLEQLFIKIDESKPDSISWNGLDFDLPVIQYRALKNSIQYPDHWDEHHHHEDLKFLLSGYNLEHSAPLDHVAKQLGYPGELLLKSHQIWDEFQEGNLNVIRQNCEINTLNTYLIFLRYQLIRGELTHNQLEQETTLLRDTLKTQSHDHDKGESENTHLGAFLKAW